jgi:hypothetical protein
MSVASEKAEMDALERHYPNGMRAFVKSWLGKFYDSTLDQRYAATTERLLASIPGSSALPEDEVSKREEILACLAKLIEIENGLETHDGYSMDVDVSPITDGPDSEQWLRNAPNGDDPGLDDIDCCGGGADE